MSNFIHFFNHLLRPEPEPQPPYQHTPDKQVELLLFHAHMLESELAGLVTEICDISERVAAMDQALRDLLPELREERVS